MPHSYLSKGYYTTCENQGHVLKSICNSPDFNSHDSCPCKMQIHLLLSRNFQEIHPVTLSLENPKIPSFKLSSCVHETTACSLFQFSSVAQSCPTLCNPMNCSTPGLPVHHQLPEFTKTHVHRVSDAIQPSHPLSSPSPPAPNPS